MSNTKNMLAILLITLFFIGSAAAGTEKEMTPSGTIHFEEWQVMAILGGDWGHGTLGYNGKVYKFKITGMGAGGLGAQKISATGDVYNLKDISDFPGGYSELRGGIAAERASVVCMSATIKASSLSLKRTAKVWLCQ